MFWCHVVGAKPIPRDDAYYPKLPMTSVESLGQESGSTSFQSMSMSRQSGRSSYREWRGFQTPGGASNATQEDHTLLSSATTTINASFNDETDKSQEGGSGDSLRSFFQTFGSSSRNGSMGGTNNRMRSQTSTPANDKNGIDPSPPKFRPFPLLLSSNSSCPRRPQTLQMSKRKVTEFTKPGPPSMRGTPDWNEADDEPESVVVTPALVPCRLRLDSTDEVPNHEVDVPDGARGGGARRTGKPPMPLKTLLSLVDSETGDSLNQPATTTINVDVHKESRASPTSSGCGSTKSSSSPTQPQHKQVQQVLERSVSAEERVPMILNGIDGAEVSVSRPTEAHSSGGTSRSNSIEGPSTGSKTGEYVLMSNKNSKVPVSNNNNMNNDQLAFPPPSNHSPPK